jgi:class 3 adenylate cyclase
MARRLAAILAGDVVGYSRLIAVDEARTHERLKALRQIFIEPKIDEHHGRIAKLMGDGALVESARAWCARPLSTARPDPLSSAKENDHVHPIVFRHPALQHQCSGRGTGRSPPPPGGDPLA